MTAPFKYEPIGLSERGCDCHLSRKLRPGQAMGDDPNRFSHDPDCRRGAISRVHAMMSDRFAPENPTAMRLLADELHAAASQWERAR